MFLVRTPKDGTPLRVYELNWIPGATIAKLPKLAKPLALAYRNARVLLAYVRNCLSRRVPDISAIEVQKNLALGIQYVYEAGVAGDIAEFGTPTATTAYAIAAEMSKLESMYRILYEMRADYRFKPKKLHLFDSFEGLPVAESATDQQSPHVSSGVWGGGTSKPLVRKG